jgi:hypothetical protein
MTELLAVIRAASHPVETRPVTDLWPGIRSRLDYRPRSGRLVHWTARRVTMSLPELVLAASLLVAVSAGLSWLATNREVRPAPAAEPTIRAVSEPLAPASAVLERTDFADEQFDAAVADLEQILLEHRDALDPRTVRVLERNLQAIDEAIRQARQALDADPANPYLNSHLVDARQRKLALLRRAAMLASEGT